MTKKAILTIILVFLVVSLLCSCSAIHNMFNDDKTDTTYEEAEIEDSTQKSDIDKDIITDGKLSNAEKSENDQNAENIDYVPSIIEDRIEINGEDWFQGKVCVDNIWRTLFYKLFSDEYFCLPIGTELAEPFSGKYALLSDASIINIDGEIVFRLSDTDYDEIVSTETEDVAFIICRKYVDTYEYTGDTYYKINLETGESTDITNEVLELRYNRREYLGNGLYFIVDAPYVLYDIRTGIKNSIIKETEDGTLTEDINQECEPSDYYRFGDTLYWVDNEYWEYGDPQYWYEYYLNLNEGIIRTVRTYCLTDIILGNKPEAVCDGKVVKWVDINDRIDYLYDRLHDVQIDMSDYYSFEILAWDDRAGEAHDEFELLLKVENEGGGTYITRVHLDDSGIDAFSPIKLTDLLSVNHTEDSENNYFMMENPNEENVLGIYTWDGENVTNVDKNAGYLFGADTVLIQKSGDSSLYMMNLEAGDTVLVEEKSYAIYDWEYLYDGMFIKTETDGIYYILTEDGKIKENLICVQ